METTTAIADLTELDLILMLTAASTRTPKIPCTPASENQIKLIAKLAKEKFAEGLAVGSCATFTHTGTLDQYFASQLIDMMLALSSGPRVEDVALNVK